MTDRFGVAGRVIVITGGYGVLGAGLATGLAAEGARLVILGRRLDAAEALVRQLRESGGEAMALQADVLDEGSLRGARDRLLAEWGRVDALINAAGGNVARARSDGRSVFTVPMDAHDEALRLNLHGTVVPTMIFGETMGAQRSGCIVNVSSMAALRALSGTMGYAMAKAGVDNFTRWMAVEMARRHGDGVRVNAIAPGFFVTTQNHAVLVRPDGGWTPRAEAILAHTPMGRFGRPEELLGAVQWLCSDAASFVTGAVIPVDGGFSVDSGV